MRLADFLTEWAHFYDANASDTDEMRILIDRFCSQYAESLEEFESMQNFLYDVYLKGDNI